MMRAIVMMALLQPAQWPFVSAPTDSAFVNESTSGFVRFDVTSDVQAFVSGSAQNYGWVLKRTDESQPGFVWLYEKDSPPPPAGPGAPPKLILHVASQDTTTPTVPSQPGFPASPLFTASPDGSEIHLRNAVEVRFDSAASGTTVNAFLAKYGGTIIGGFPGPDVYVIEIPDPGPDWSDLSDVMEAMRQEPGIATVQEIVTAGDIGQTARYPGDGTIMGAARTNWFSGALTDYRLLIADH